MVTVTDGVDTMIRFFVCIALLFFAIVTKPTSVSSQVSCNSGNPWVTQFGPIITGDLMAYGPNCNQFQDSGSVGTSGIINIEAFGADPTGIKDSTVAIQNASNSITNGGILWFPHANYSISGPININFSQTILCTKFLGASFATINNTGGGGSALFIINISFVTVRDCTLNRAGATIGDAIDIGVGASGLGIFGIVIDNVELVNHAIGFNIGNASEYKIINSKINAANCFLIFNHVWQGSGASHISGNECLAGTGNSGAIIHSGADVRFVNNKFLFGDHAFNVIWDQSAEGNLLIQDSSIETYAVSAIKMNFSFAFDRILIQNNSFAGNSGTGVIDLSNASTGVPINLVVTGNGISGSGGGVILSVGTVNQCIISGNVINFNGTGTAVALLSNSNNCKVGGNQLNVATALTNAGTGNTTTY